MYWNLKFAGLGGFVQSVYWSSSEEDAYGAYYQDFTNGAHGNYDKTNSNYVRAIRAFSTAKSHKEKAEVEPVWIRTMPMTCYQVWVNSDNMFEMVFWYPYRDNNWVKIYDMSGKQVYSVETDLRQKDLLLQIHLMTMHKMIT